MRELPSHGMAREYDTSPLGKRQLYISSQRRRTGRELVCVTSITVPTSSSIRVTTTKVKKISSLAKGGKQQSGPTTPVIKMNGDAFQFGLESDAMLRVLVHVVILVRT
mmetsp:Transcript_28223/g.47971  ORF Transcript_28223/g.47971 Transcript_28223/m.47971 type:complete len:108 (-) Transcript_28223:110-433(-)